MTKPMNIIGPTRLMLSEPIPVNEALEVVERAGGHLFVEQPENISLKFQVNWPVVSTTDTPVPRRGFSHNS